MRGDVWWCDTSSGRRPVVVLSRNEAIPAHRRVLVAPCTSKVRGLISEVVLEPPGDPVPSVSAVNMDSIESVALEAFVERLGWLTVDRMHDVCAALAVAVDC